MIEAGIHADNGNREESTEPSTNFTNEERYKDLMKEVELGLRKHKVNGYYIIYVMHARILLYNIITPCVHAQHEHHK